jgi:hypothetical protein
MVNLVTPLAEAVKKSPVPFWSITRPAKEEFAEIEATGVVPELILPNK